MQEINTETVQNMVAQGEPFCQSAEFWVAVAFIIVVAALLIPLKRAAAGLVEKRISRIKNELQEAENLKFEAQKLYAGYERKVAGIDMEVAEILSEQRDAIEETKEKKMHELDILLQRKENEVDGRIEQSFEQAGKEIQDIVSGRTDKILRKVISSKLTKSDYNQLIESSINSIKDISVAEWVA